MGLKIIITEDQYKKLLNKTPESELNEYVAKLNFGGCSNLNFDAFSEKLGNRSEIKIANNTYLRKVDNDHIGIKYHSTNIIIIERYTNTIRVNSGGYWTPTTKGRINQILDCYDAYIFQNKGIWYIKGSNGTFDYTDGINVYDDGYVELPKSKD